jgi:hypothetical protein
MSSGLEKNSAKISASPSNSKFKPGNSTRLQNPDLTGALKYGIMRSKRAEALKRKILMVFWEGNHGRRNTKGVNRGILRDSGEGS